jgi:hypothetical protein
MSDVINIMAEDNRNIIDDDAVPTLTLENSNASGTALKAVASTSGGIGVDVNVTGAGAGLDVDVTGGGTAGDFASSTGAAIAAEGAAISAIRSTASAVGALQVEHKSTVLASPTVAPLKVVVSVASGALVDFGTIDSGAVISAATGGPTIVSAFRVKFGDSYGWVRAYMD